MFGKADVGSDWAGSKWEYHTETFMAMENEKVVTKRLNELGAAGYECVGVLDKAIGLVQKKGEGAYTLLFKRQA